MPNVRHEIGPVMPRHAVSQVVESEPFITSAGRRGTIHRRAGCTTSTQDAVVAIGQFDGVHTGHRALVAEVALSATSSGVAAGVVTFDRHPLSLLSPEAEPPELTTLPEKVGLLLAAGLDFVVVLHLDAALLATDAIAFVDDLLITTLEVSGVVVGPNFRFGHRAAGDPALLRELGTSRGFDVYCPQLACVGDGAVSSTRIRTAIRSGELDAAEALLGRPPRFDCRVVWSARSRLLLTVRDSAARPRAGRFVGLLEQPGQPSVPVSATVRAGRMVVRLHRPIPSILEAGDHVGLVLRNREAEDRPGCPERLGIDEEATA